MSVNTIITSASSDVSGGNGDSLNINRVNEEKPTGVPIMSLCLFCCKKATSTGVQLEDGAVGGDRGKVERDIQERFFQVVWSRFDSESGRKRSYEQLFPSRGLGGLSKTCEDCFRIINGYCDLYHQLKVTELKLNWQIEKLWQVMKHADRVPSRVKAFQEQYKDANEEGNNDNGSAKTGIRAATKCYEVTPGNKTEYSTNVPMMKPKSLITTRRIFKRKYKRYRSKIFPRVLLNRGDCFHLNLKKPEAITNQKSPSSSITDDADTTADVIKKEENSLETHSDTSLILRERLLLGWISSITAVIFLYYLDIKSNSYVRSSKSADLPQYFNQQVPKEPEKYTAESGITKAEKMEFGSQEEKVEIFDEQIEGPTVEECSTEKHFIGREIMEDFKSVDESMEVQEIHGESLEENRATEAPNEREETMEETIEMGDPVATNTEIIVCAAEEIPVVQELTPSASMDDGFHQKEMLVSEFEVEQNVLVNSNNEPEVPGHFEEEHEVFEISDEEQSITEHPMEELSDISRPTAELGVYEVTEEQFQDAGMRPPQNENVQYDQRIELVDLASVNPREILNSCEVYSSVTTNAPAHVSQAEVPQEEELENRSVIVDTVFNNRTQNHSLPSDDVILVDNNVTPLERPVTAQPYPFCHQNPVNSHIRSETATASTRTNVSPNYTHCSATCPHCPPRPSQFLRQNNFQAPQLQRYPYGAFSTGVRMNSLGSASSALPWGMQPPPTNFTTHQKDILRKQILQRNNLLQNFQYSGYNAMIPRSGGTNQYYVSLLPFNNQDNYSNTLWGSHQQNLPYQLSCQPEGIELRTNTNQMNTSRSSTFSGIGPNNTDYNSVSRNNIENVETQSSSDEGPTELETSRDKKVITDVSATERSHMPSRCIECINKGANAPLRGTLALKWHQDYLHTNGQVALEKRPANHEVTMQKLRLEGFPSQLRHHPCPVGKCSKKFALTTELDLHSKVRHSEQNFTCHFCDLAIPSSAVDLIDHEGEHVPIKRGQKFVCGRCGVATVNKTEFINHYLEAHLGLPIIQAKCPICCQTFKGFEKLPLTHYVNFHDLTRLDDPTKPFRCESSKCPAYFLTEDQLHTHWNKIHRNINTSLNTKITRMEKAKKAQAYKERTMLAPKNFKCPHCPKTFSCTPFLRTHVWKLHGKGASLKQLSGEQNYIQKMVISFPEEGITVEDIVSDRNAKHICCIDNCNKGFMEATDLETHFKLHGQFKCSFCEVVKSFAPELAIHEALHKVSSVASGKNQSRKNFCCARCPFSAHRKPDYVDHHLEKHLGLAIDRKRCPICKLVYAYEDSNNKAMTYVVLKHYQDYHDKNEGDNDIPTTGVAEAQRQKLYQCDRDECRAFFLKSVQLMEHISEVHNNVSWRVLELPKCSDCGKLFRRRSLLREHRIRKHKLSEASFQFACDVAECCRRFETEVELAHHSDFVHSLGQEQLECTQENCTSKFWTKSGLLSHVRLSHGEKNSNTTTSPVVCDECGKLFKCKFHLEVHQQFHAGPESWKFACSVCNKKIFSQQKLDEHMRVHTKEKPFVCKVCGIAYAHRHNLRIHNNNKHGLQDIAKKVNRVHKASSRKGKTYKVTKKTMH